MHILMKVVRFMSKSRQIYIVLSNPCSIVAKMIGWYTKAPFNHVSIAFDEHLDIMYSFGRKHDLIPLIGGFVQENIHSQLLRDARCALYRYTVSEETYDKMKCFVEQFASNQDRYRYNFIGIIGIILNLELGGEDAYFCSQFVHTVLKQGGIELLEKPVKLTTPSDFEYSQGLELVYRGYLKMYHESLETQKLSS